MYAPDVPTVSSTLPTPSAASAEGFFTNGVPGSVPRTILDADYMNMLMMEVRNVVVFAGLTPSKTTYTQLYAAITSLVSGGATPNATESVAGKARIATTTEVDAGSDNTLIVSPFHLFDGFGVTGGAGAGSLTLPKWMGSIIVNWGQQPPASQDDGPQTNLFAKSFTSAVWGVVASCINTGADVGTTGDQGIQIIDWTLSQVRTLTQSYGAGSTDTIARGGTFIAIGV